MKRSRRTVFIHFSKFHLRDLIVDLVQFKNWHESQTRLTEICLCFPSFFWREIRNEPLLSTWLIRLIKEKCFLYIPNTYSGENHQTLSLEEAKLDLEWTLKNESQTGYCDIFKEEPTAIYISNRELYRPKFQTLYHQYRQYLLMEGIKKDKHRSYLFCKQDSRKGYIPLRKTPNGKFSLINWLKNHLYFLEEDSFLYWSSLDNQDLKRFLSWLPINVPFQAKLPASIKAYPAYFNNFAPVQAEADLAIRTHAFLRQINSPSTPIKELIEKNLCAIFSPSSSPKEELKGEPQQVLEAETSLTCSNMQLLFKKGQLLTWKQTNKKLPTLPVGKSYCLGKRLKESFYHCFSLNQGHLNGVRQVVFSSRQYSSSLDYFCLEQEKGFLVNANFSWNAQIFKTSKVLLAPLELALYRLDEESSLKVIVLNTQNDNYERYINDDELTDVLWGEGYFFQHPVSPLMLSFTQKGKKIKFPLSLKTKKIKGSYYLFVNLGGFYSPIDLSVHKTWHHSFSLFLNQPEKVPFRPLHISEPNTKELRSCHIWLTKN